MIYWYFIGFRFGLGSVFAQKLIPNTWPSKFEFSCILWKKRTQPSVNNKTWNVQLHFGTSPISKLSFSFENGLLQDHWKIKDFTYITKWGAVQEQLFRCFPIGKPTSWKLKSSKIPSHFKLTVLGAYWEFTDGNGSKMKLRVSSFTFFTRLSFVSSTKTTKTPVTSAMWLGSVFERVDNLFRAGFTVYRLATTHFSALRHSTVSREESQAVSSAIGRFGRALASDICAAGSGISFWSQSYRYVLSKPMRYRYIAHWFLQIVMTYLEPGLTDFGVDRLRIAISRLSAVKSLVFLVLGWGVELVLQAVRLE